MSGERCRRVAGGARFRNLGRLRPRYNLGPQSYIPVVRGTPRGAGGQSTPSAAAGPRGRELCAMKWGLVPSFAKRPEDFDVFKGGSSTFNARVEGLDSSSMWKRLLDSHRGVVLFDGFYEWKTVGKGKVPMFIRNRDEYDGHAMLPSADDHGDTKEKCPDADASHADLPVLHIQTASQAEVASQAEGAEAAQGAEASQAGPPHAPLMLAALFDTWRPRETKLGEASADECLETVTIITMGSDGTPVAQVHDRMPVFLTPETAAAWLDSSVSFGKAIGPILRTAQAHANEQLSIYEVSSLVSNVKSESPDCVLPKKEMDAKQFSKGLGKFFAKKGQEAAPEKRKADDEQVQTVDVLRLPEKVARTLPMEVIVLD